MDIKKKLINEFSLKSFQVENTIKLIDDGNTIPFIARYRKEMTGELDDQVLRELYERLTYLRNLEAKGEEIKRLIEEQDKLTKEISDSIEKAVTLQELEDIYRPYRPKRKTRASVAKEKGLMPLAALLMGQMSKMSELNAAANDTIDEDKGVCDIASAFDGAKDIIAEEIADNSEIRKEIRKQIYETGIVLVKSKKEEDSVYRMYYDYKEPLKKLVSHRILAINRGEKEEFLKVKIEVNQEELINIIENRIIRNFKFEGIRYIKESIEDSFSRLLFPSIEREIRNELTEMAEDQAMKVFKENLKNLLMQAPVKNKVVLGLDPAYRTGCKIAVVDETGKVLETTVIYPTPPYNKVLEAGKILEALINKHKVDIIAIGNGTASKESEIFVAELIKNLKRNVYYMVVSEAGASVYSASKLGAEEFPEFDVALRSAVSIARRLEDPLAELVKIDPKAIGIGQYQHDMNQKKLGETLGGVVEDCVNSVGVDLNTASPSLLSYISGISGTIAKNIVKYREEIGHFTDRRQLKKVKMLGEKAFEQCAGFLRIPGGKVFFDNTSVHPESYDIAEKLIERLNLSVHEVNESILGMIDLMVKQVGLQKLSKELNVGEPTLADIINEIKKPGRDPRDELPAPMLQSDVLHIEDLKPGMILNGTVRNVADFGAFVDIGVHQDGLVHISQLADRFVKNAMEVVSVGDIVKVKVLEVDCQRKRISLSMKDA